MKKPPVCKVAVGLLLVVGAFWLTTRLLPPPNPFEAAYKRLRPGMSLKETEAILNPIAGQGKFDFDFGPFVWYEWYHQGDRVAVCFWLTDETIYEIEWDPHQPEKSVLQGLRSLVNW